MIVHHETYKKKVFFFWFCFLFFFFSFNKHFYLSTYVAHPQSMGNVIQENYENSFTTKQQIKTEKWEI